MNDTPSVGGEATLTEAAPTAAQTYKANVEAIKSGRTFESTPATNSEATPTTVADTTDYLSEIKSQYGDKEIEYKYKGQMVKSKISDILANPSAIRTVNEAMNEKNNAIKLATTVVNGLKTDPLRGLAALLNPNNPNELPEAYRQQLLQQLLSQVPTKDRVRILEQKLIEDVTEINMSPEEKAARAERQELENYRREKARQEQEARNQQAAQALQAEQKNILSAVAQEMGLMNLPNDDDYRMTIMREAMGMMLTDVRRAKANGTTPRVSVKAALNAAKDRIYNSYRKTVVESPAENLIDILGPETIEKIRKHLVEKHKAKQRKPNQTVTGNTGKPSKKAEPAKVKNYSQYQENIKKILGR